MKKIGTLLYIRDTINIHGLVNDVVYVILIRKMANNIWNKVDYLKYWIGDNINNAFNKKPENEKH